MNDMELACFLSVARTGSFTISAREISSTQQAVSRNIQSLEAELGFELLHRGSNAITLTWAGERFLRWRKEHDEQLSSLERLSRRMTGAGLNELYVAWTDWTGCPAGVEEDIRGFRQNYPDVRLHTRQASAEELTAMLSDGNADIAILPEHSAHDLQGLIVSPAFAEQPLYIFSREPIEGADPSMLAGRRLVAAAMGEPDEDIARRRVNMFCAALGIAPKKLDILPNVRSTFSELLCGDCYTIAPETEILRGMYRLRLPGPGMRLVFITPQGKVSPWVSLFESYARQRRSEGR